MAGKTPTPEQSETPAPQADPILMRQNQIKQHMQQINGRISEMRQQRTLIDDMLASLNDQAHILQGRLEECAYNQQNQI